MKVLSVDQAGLFAWSNSKKNKSLFATASIYDSFSNADSTQEEGILQLYSLDIVHKTSSSKKLGIAKIEGLQFTSLNWHAFGEDALYPYGVIASGFNEGSVGLWDVNTILQNTAGNAEDINGRGLICLQNVHSAPVKALSFNPIRRHLLASGGSEVAIHNIEKDIADPEVFSPGDNLHEGSFVTSVSWNRTVPHILGSASQNGVSVVWDLKINKPIFNFSDNNRGLNRNVSLSWSPEIPTQFAVAYDDEKTPEFQIWDLRNPKGPIYCSMKGHTKGIHSLDWCLTDPSLIVTLGRDNKTCIWNYKVSDSNPIVSESALNEPCTSVQWSPMQPEIYALTSAAGSSTVYSLNDQIDHIPIWLRPPVGARFSFDGRLAVFSQKGEGRVREYDVNPEEDQLLPYILDFEQNFLTSQVDINSLCDSRIFSKLLTEEEKEEWKFIKASISNNPDDIIKVIGLDKEKVIKKAEDYTNKTYTKDVASNAHRTNDFNFRVPSQKEADDFFNFLAEQGNKAGSSQHQQVNDEDADGEVTVTETITKNTNWNAGIEKVIKENILIGNIEGAVDSALKCGRVAEAFLLAYSKGEDFFRNTVESYVTSCNDSFVKNVVRYLVEDEITELVQKYPLEDWKECVALCVSLTNGANHTFRQHMDELALRFSKASEHSSALLCYILSKNFLRILETFAFRTESFQKGSDEHTIFLLRTIEKLIALRIITNNLDSNPIVDRFIYELTKPLHVYKRDTLILNLFTINNSSGFECLILKDRILSSSQEHSKGHYRQQFPFRQETVNSKLKPQIDHSRKPGIGHNPQAQSQQMSRPTQAHPQPHAQGQSQFPQAGQPKPAGFQPGFKPSVEPAHGLGNAPIKGHQHDVPPISNVQPKNFPPPTGGMGMPKPTGAPFNQGPGFSPSVQSSTKDLSHPPPTSFTQSTQAPFGTAGKGPLNTSAQDLSMSSTTGPLTDSSRLGAKATPFSGAQSIQTSQSFQQESIPDQSPTMGRPQQQRPGPPVKAQPPGFKGPAMPKGVGGPVRASQPGLPSTQPGQPISGPIGGGNPGPLSGPTGAPLGGPTGHPQGGPPTGLMGGPPVRPGPGNNPPKQPVPVTSPVQHVQQQVSQSTTLQSSGQIGGPQLGGPPLGGQPLGGPSLGGPTRGPVPGGMGGPPKTQGFKPGMPAVPGKGPVQMPPRMPGAGPGPNMGGQVPRS